MPPVWVERRRCLPLKRRIVVMCAGIRRHSRSCTFLCTERRASSGQSAESALRRSPFPQHRVCPVAKLPTLLVLSASLCSSDSVVGLRCYLFRLGGVVRREASSRPGKARASEPRLRRKSSTSCHKLVLEFAHPRLQATQAIAFPRSSAPTAHAVSLTALLAAVNALMGGAAAAQPCIHTLFPGCAAAKIALLEARGAQLL